MQIGGGCKTDFRFEGKCSSPGCCKGGRRKSRRKRGGQKKRKRDRIKAWFNKKFSRKKKDAAVPFIRELMPGREKKLRQVRIPQPGPVQPGKTLTTRDKQRAKKKKKKKKVFVVADSLNSVFDARLEERDRVAALDAAAQTVNADTPPPRRAAGTGYTIYGSDAAAAESKRALLEAMGVLKPLEDGEKEDPERVRRAEEEVVALGVGGMADVEYEKAVRKEKYLKAIRDPPTRSPLPPPRRKSFGGRKRRKTRRRGGRKRRTRRRRRRGGRTRKKRGGVKWGPKNYVIEETPDGTPPGIILRGANSNPKILLEDIRVVTRENNSLIINENIELEFNAGEDINRWVTYLTPPPPPPPAEPWTENHERPADEAGGFAGDDPWLDALNGGGRQRKTRNFRGGGLEWTPPQNRPAGGWTNDNLILPPLRINRRYTGNVRIRGSPLGGGFINKTPYKGNDLVINDNMISWRSEDGGQMTWNENQIVSIKFESEDIRFAERMAPPSPPRQKGGGMRKTRRNRRRRRKKSRKSVR